MIYNLSTIKKTHYELILKELNKGWTDYLNERISNTWLDDDYIELMDMDEESELNFYNDCWTDWLYYNYNINKMHYMTRLEIQIWDELLNISENKTKIKLIIYIILISFSYYITN